MSIFICSILVTFFLLYDPWSNPYHHSTTAVFDCYYDFIPFQDISSSVPSVHKILVQHFGENLDFFVKCDKSLWDFCSTMSFTDLWHESLLVKSFSDCWTSVRPAVFLQWFAALWPGCFLVLLLGVISGCWSLQESSLLLSGILRQRLSLCFSIVQRFYWPLESKHVAFLHTTACFDI